MRDILSVLSFPMQIARTNYNKDSSTTTQPSSSSKFLEAQLPPDEESSNLVENILDVVAAVASGEAVDGGDTKSEASPEFGKNLIQLISQKQQEEDKSVMAKVKAELEETLQLVRPGRREKIYLIQSPVDAVASVASESSLVPVPVSDSVKEVREVIQRMEKAIANFCVSESDELPTSVINSPKTQSERLLVELQAARRRISISDLREPVRAEPSLSRAQSIIESIESKLGRYPSGSSRGADVLINSADDDLIKPPRTYLKQIANRMGPAVPESLVSSWISSSGPDENSSISVNDSEVIELNSAQVSQRTTPLITAVTGMSRRLDVLAEAVEIEPSLPAPSIPSSPLNSPPLPESAAKLPISPESEEQKRAEAIPSPGSPEIIVFEPLSDPPSASKSPTRRANRRAGNYTLKRYSPVKTLPPRISTSPRMQSGPN